MPLDPQELQEIESRATELAKSTGRILLEHFQGPLHVEYKGKKEGDDPVTEADRRAEEFIRDELARHYPDHAIVGEEGAGTGSAPASLTWVVDPLDGTTNFVNSLPSFACSIALLEDGVPVVAAVFLPWPGAAEGRILHARKEGGAWEGERPLQVAPGHRPVAGRVVVLPGFAAGRFQARASLRQNPGERRSVGSIVYEMALVADGSYQYVVFGGPKAWDVAAGVLLIQEAGGLILCRISGRRGWHPFSAFGSIAEDGPPGQEALREWNTSIMAGNPEMVRFVASRLRLRRLWIQRIAYRIRERVPHLLHGLRETILRLGGTGERDRRRGRRRRKRRSNSE